MFWLLIVMGLGTFVPSVLLPEWRAYQSLQSTLNVQQRRLEQMRTVVERERARLMAIQSDPAVLERLARRELRYRRLGERSVPVAVEDLPQDLSATLPHPGESVAADSTKTTPVSLPVPLVQLASYLPNYDYDAVFCDGPTRRILIVMSLSLIAVALWLFDGPGLNRETLSARRRDEDLLEQTGPLA